MAFVNDRFSQPFKVASVAPPRTVVALDSVSGQVIPITNASQRPYGITQATGASPGLSVAVFESPGVAKAIAGASLGFGAEVSLASVGVASAAQSNSLATTTLLGPKSVAASGTVQWAVGVAQTPALAGEVFSVKLEPRQVSGLV